MSRPIHAVLFDFGGVIADEGFAEGLRQLAVEQGLDPDRLPQEGLDAVYDSGYVTGEGSEAEFWSLLRNRTGLRGRDEVLRQHILQRFVVRPGMLELVDRLRQQGYVTGLLSDQTDWLERLDEEHRFLDRFDVQFISYRMGRGKRDPGLFEDVARRIGLPPEEILFIDDNPDNVRRAKTKGMQALLFVDQSVLERELHDRLTLHD